MTAKRGSLRLSITVPAESSQLRLLTGVVRRCLVDGAGIYPSDAAYNQIQLAIRETCSNVVKHSYPTTPRGLLHLRLRIRRGRVLVQIEDRGIPVPMRKLLRIAASEEANPEERTEGGFGLRLIRSTMDGVKYCRKDNGVNIVRLYKRLDRAA